MSENITFLSESPRLNDRTKDDVTLHVWVDASVRNRAQHEIVEDEKPQRINRNKLDELGMNSAMNAEERRFKMNVAIDKGEVRTVQQAMRLLGVTKQTIIKYLMADERQLLDEDSNKQAGYFEREKPKASSRIKYYDADPKLGGKVITYEEHMERVRAYKSGEL